MGTYIKKIIKWILSFFKSDSISSELDQEIKDVRDNIDAIEDNKKDEHTSVDEAMDEWK